MITQPSKPNDSVRTEIGSTPAPVEGSELTAREQQIVQLLMQGMTNKGIGQQLGIVEDTVKKHLQHVYDKLGVRRRALLMLGKRE